MFKLPPLPLHHIFAGILWGLFLHFALFRCLQNSVFVKVDIPELIGAGEAVQFSYGQLLSGELARGGELNPSPLHYILDRFWAATLWRGIPQFYWDMSIFYRVPTILYWCGAAGGVFLFTYTILFRIYAAWIAIICALAAALTLFSKNLPLFNSVQDRPYSLWLALSLTHLASCYLLLHEERPLKRWGGALFGISTVLLALTTYVSLAQIGLATALLLLSRRSIPRSGWNWILPSGMLALLISAFYGTQVGEGITWSEESPAKIWGAVLFLFWQTLDPFSQALSAAPPGFHWESSVLGRTIAVCSLVAPLFLIRRTYVSFTYAMAGGLTGFALAAGWVAGRLGHEIDGPRYFIFLLPPFFALFAISCHAIATFGNRLRAGTGAYVLLAIGAALIAVNAEVQLRELRRLANPLGLFQTFTASPKPDCPRRLDEWKPPGERYWVDFPRVTYTCFGWLPHTTRTGKFSTLKLSPNVPKD